VSFARHKIFETIYLLLIAGFVFGVPVAATARPAGQEFSWWLALTQAGVATLIFAVLFVLNFVVARFVSRRVSQR
jgi:hypothetical protein